MNVEYRTQKDLPCDKLYQLFLAVGWASKDVTTQEMIDNFNISRLYSNTESANTQIQVVELPNTQLAEKAKFSVIGLIEIPSISILYPILSEMQDEFLKIAPCRFYGPNPNEIRKSLYCWS